MRTRTGRWPATLLAALLFPLTTSIAVEEGTSGVAATEILSRLDRRLQAVTTMKGRFIQSFTSAGLGVPQSESGRFFISRPDRMRWDYTRPEEKTAISDGTHTWLHLPEEGVVYKGSVAAWKNGGAFSILAGGSLRDEYSAIDVDVAQATRKGDVVLALKPRRERDEFVSLLVEVDPVSLTLVSVVAVDGAGNRISAFFSEIEENVALPRDVFLFKPPVGARVIDQDHRPAAIVPPPK